MKKTTLGCLVFLAAATGVWAQKEKPLLLQGPTLSARQIAFAYGDDIWIVDRGGGDARRLVSGGGMNSGPYFSPDGATIAYTSNASGHDEVYLVPAAGGEPRRLTYHAAADVAAGWTPDGRKVLFHSLRANYSRFVRLYTVPLTGGFPEELPLPTGIQGSFSPDGSHIAYVPHWNITNGVDSVPVAFKHYRGGKTSPLWIADLADSSIEAVPRNNSNDFNPMWVGDALYFLSDRNGPVTLFRYVAKTREVKELVRNDGFDLKSAGAGPGAIVYEQFGSLHLYDLATGRAREVRVRLNGEMPQWKPHSERAAPEEILNGGASPDGDRAVFEIHGDIFKVSTGSGGIRNLTHSPGVADRDPSWSPDGKWIACFSDESGEYALHLIDPEGAAPVRTIDLGHPPGFFYRPVWSPDSRKIAYSDQRLNLWCVDLDRPAPIRVDTDRFESADHHFDAVWSPDNRWLVYTKQLENHLHAIFAYSLADRRIVPLTDGMSDARFPVFDRKGKKLYFAASTDAGLAAGWFDMTVYEHIPESNIYQIDLDGPDGRAQALPFALDSYVGLYAGEAGILYASSRVPENWQSGRLGATVQRFDVKTGAAEKLLEHVFEFAVSANGKELLFEQGGKWFLAPGARPPLSGEGALKSLDRLEVRIDPRAEWRQMYHEAWRIERDRFYDPHYHGLDLAAAERTYAPFLDGIASRTDLNTLFTEMLGNLCVSHLVVSGGARPPADRDHLGLLGADYAVENGRYRLTRVYDGGNWNPRLRAPLAQPGSEARAGEYLLAVNGRPLRSADDLYRSFLGTAGKPVALQVGPNPDGSGSREIAVTPVDSESALRHVAWIDDNRRKVGRLSGGRLAYVYLPDTGKGGFMNFNRYYFAQVGKAGAIIDERFNGGGQFADYIIDYLHRPLMSFLPAREGEALKEPVEAIFGPKVMITNETAGSGGDVLPWYFRKAGIGPLVGTRTMGGLVGTGGNPPLIDGGLVTAPCWPHYGLQGQWEVENQGIAPDYEVPYDPKLVREGHDPQLEKAVAVALDLLKQHPLPAYPVPEELNYHPRLPDGP